jgi:hypothetical protein
MGERTLADDDDGQAHVGAGGGPHRFLQLRRDLGPGRIVLAGHARRAEVAQRQGRAGWCEGRGGAGGGAESGQQPGQPYQQQREDPT